MKKFVSIVLALCMCVALGVTAFAAEIDTDGGSGSTPVSLTTANDGIGGSDITPTKMSVTVPTVFPMAMSDEGDVVTATGCRIVNNSYGAVRVSSVTISAAEGWHLTSFGDKSVLAAEQVDSNKLGFAMSIGGGAQVKTNGTDSTQVLISAPVVGCYMTGAGDPEGSVAGIEYDGIVTPLSNAVTNATVASVVFVIEWDAVSNG